MLKIKYLSFIMSVIFLTLIIGYSVFAWIPAPANPPSDNVDIPLNVSSDPQVKSAGLQLESLIVRGSAYLSTVSGSIGIGTASPTSKLDVNGTMNVTGNITASGNIWDSCRNLAMSCSDSYSCNSGEFLTRVERHTGSALCDAGGGNFYYRMSATCCQI